jgi:hypothetical protein
MYPYNASERGRDYGFEFAPTAAIDVAQLDVRHPRVKWFRQDANRAITLSLGELAK